MTPSTCRNTAIAMNFLNWKRVVMTKRVYIVAAVLGGIFGYHVAVLGKIALTNSRLAGKKGAEFDIATNKLSAINDAERNKYNSMAPGVKINLNPVKTAKTDGIPKSRQFEDDVLGRSPAPQAPAPRPLLRAGGRRTEVHERREDRVRLWDIYERQARDASASHCGPRFLAHPPMPVTALASAFPGERSSFVRHLIERVTGYLTGSEYNDDVTRHMFPANHVIDGRAVVVETHHDPWLLPRRPSRSTLDLWSVMDIMSTPERAIVIMRRPHEGLVSEYIRKTYGGSASWVREDLFLSKEWELFANRMGGRWFDWTRSWILFPKPKLILFMEDIVQNLKPELEKICDFLDLTIVCTEERIQCVIDSVAEELKLVKGDRLTFDPYMYTKTARKKLNFRILEIKSNLEELGIPCPWQIL